jgi:hypothetical protein
MTMQIVVYTVIGAGYTLFLAIAILLVRTYRRTREIGFIWLGAAVLVWPLLGRLIESRLRFDALGQAAGLLHLLQQVVGLALLLVAVVYLGRQIDSERLTS